MITPTGPYEFGYPSTNMDTIVLMKTKNIHVLKVYVPKKIIIVFQNQVIIIIIRIVTLAIT